jgi:hypothetical protein
LRELSEERKRGRRFGGLERILEERRAHIVEEAFMVEELEEVPW